MEYFRLFLKIEIESKQTKKPTIVRKMFQKKKISINKTEMMVKFTAPKKLKEKSLSMAATVAALFLVRTLCNVHMLLLLLFKAF